MIEGILRLRGRILRAGVPSLVSRGAVVVWGLFSILIVRALPRDAYAAYSIARSIQFFGIMLGGGFVMQAITKFVAEGVTDREKRITNAGIVLSMGIAVLVAMVILALGGTLRSFYAQIDLRGIPWVIALLVITSTASTLPHSILAARYRMVRMMVADVSSVAVRIGIVSILLLRGSLTSPLQIFGAMICGNVVATIVGGLFARRHLSFRLRFRRRHLGMLFGFSVVTLGAGLANTVHARTDILLLGRLSGELQTSGYAACRTLTALVDNLNMAAKTIMLPLISRMWSQGRKGEIVPRVMGAILIISMIQIPVVAVFAGFPSGLLRALYGGKYDAAAPVLMILGLLSLAKPFGSMFACMSVAVGKPSYTLYVITASALVNVALNLMLIPPYGAVGAAIATTVSVVLGAAVIIVLSLRYLKRAPNQP
ncbi:oligosaccharide flippase family protein [Candidatus Fermentibacteria bacterium]|nr:oligosaccharide flippase family protein [Candidatus Fermentibacteria bacterium]